MQLPYYSRRLLGETGANATGGISGNRTQEGIEQNIPNMNILGGTGATSFLNTQLSAATTPSSLATQATTPSAVVNPTTASSATTLSTPLTTTSATGTTSLNLPVYTPGGEQANSSSVVYPGGLSAADVARQNAAEGIPQYAQAGQPGSGYLTEAPMSSANQALYNADSTGANDAGFQSFPYYHDPANEQSGYWSYLLAQQNNTLPALVQRVQNWGSQVDQSTAINNYLDSRGMLPSTQNVAAARASLGL